MNAALDRGDIVVGTLRNMALKEEIEARAPGRAFVVPLDVDHAGQAVPAVDEAVRLLGGRLDVLVNNAAFGIFGPLEQCSDDDYRRVMETNLFGLIRVTRADLPPFRESKGMMVRTEQLRGGKEGGRTCRTW